MVGRRRGSELEPANVPLVSKAGKNNTHQHRSRLMAQMEFGDCPRAELAGVKSQLVWLSVLPISLDNAELAGRERVVKVTALCARSNCMGAGGRYCRRAQCLLLNLRTRIFNLLEISDPPTPTPKLAVEGGHHKPRLLCSQFPGQPCRRPTVQDKQP